MRSPFNDFEEVVDKEVQEIKGKLKSYDKIDYLKTTDGYIIQPIEPKKTTLIVHLRNVLKPQVLEELRERYEEESGFRVIIFDDFVKNYTVVSNGQDVIIQKEERK